jgi:hypothetical protein
MDEPVPTIETCQFCVYREDSFHVIDVLLLQDNNHQFGIEESYWYSSRVKYHNGGTAGVFAEDLEEDDWLNDAKFKDKYHVCHQSSFWFLVEDLIKDHNDFRRSKKNHDLVVLSLGIILKE